MLHDISSALSKKVHAKACKGLTLYSLLMAELHNRQCCASYLKYSLRVAK